MIAQTRGPQHSAAQDVAPTSQVRSADTLSREAARLLASARSALLRLDASTLVALDQQFDRELDSARATRQVSFSVPVEADATMQILCLKYALQRLSPHVDAGWAELLARAAYVLDVVKDCAFDLDGASVCILDARFAQVIMIRSNAPSRALHVLLSLMAASALLDPGGCDIAGLLLSAAREVYGAEIAAMLDI